MADAPQSPTTTPQSYTSPSSNLTAQSIIESLPDGVGDLFAPMLQDACGGRLGSIGWFRADWQRGGAKTGRATWDLAPDQIAHPVRGDRPADGRTPVVIKIPVRPVEYLWNGRMQPDAEDPHGITAQMYASGTSLGGYDLAWIVMERFAAGPIFGLRRTDTMQLIADAAARFYRRALRYAVDDEPRQENWPALIERAREACRNEALPNSQRWHEAIKKLQKRSSALIEEWESRPVTGWIHGDLHPANVMSRADDDPSDPAMLIDLAEVRSGHWVEDAVYLERIYWARRSVIDGHDPVREIAKARKRYGIHGSGPDGSEGDVQRLAEIRRALLAATAPAYLKSEGNPIYLAACLDVLDAAMSRLA